MKESEIQNPPFRGFNRFLRKSYRFLRRFLHGFYRFLHGFYVSGARGLRVSKRFLAVSIWFLRPRRAPRARRRPQATPPRRGADSGRAPRPWRRAGRPPSATAVAAASVSPRLLTDLRARQRGRPAGSPRPPSRCEEVTASMSRPPSPPPPPNCAKLTAWSGHAARNTSIALWGGGELEISRVGRTYQGLAGVIRLEQGRSGIS